MDRPTRRPRAGTITAVRRAVAITAVVAGLLTFVVCVGLNEADNGRGNYDVIAAIGAAVVALAFPFAPRGRSAVTGTRDHAEPYSRSWPRARVGGVRTEPGIAVVTGAGSGLGREISRALLDDGWRVAVAGRRENALVETAGRSSNVLVVPTDVADGNSVRALFQAVVDAWGRLDLLVNNAGMTGPVGAPDEVDLEGWHATVGVNLTGAFLCAREAFGIMRRQEPQGGRILNNGSIAAHVGRPGGIAYTATKHAVTGITRSIALDGRPFGIACGQFDVGNAATDMTARMREGVVQPNGERVVEPTFDPVHVADAVRYMVGLPLEANVPFLTVMATTMPYLGRG